MGIKRTDRYRVYIIKALLSLIVIRVQLCEILSIFLKEEIEEGRGIRKRKTIQ